VSALRSSLQAAEGTAGLWKEVTLDERLVKVPEGPGTNAASDVPAKALAPPSHLSAGLPTDPDKECRKIYRQIARNTWRSGVDERKVAESMERYCFQEGAHYYLKPEASRPTGLALGHPLPDARVAKRLWLLCKAVEHRLAELGAWPTFAFVPASRYHITILNRSHFDNGVVFDLNQKEFEEAEGVIVRASTGPISVDIDGLLLSSDGRLLARGFPRDEGMFELRRQLTAKIPNAGGIATIAHIKLGHFLVCPPRERLCEFLGWLGRCSQLLSHRLVFEDVYTPVARISL
jgi:hypothetical protein